jgi:hypothetical protein
MILRAEVVAEYWVSGVMAQAAACYLIVQYVQVARRLQFHSFLVRL